MDSDKMILSPRFGRNESMVCCVYCKKPKDVKAFGLLSPERAAELFDQALDMIEGEVRAPEQVFLDGVPCRRCCGGLSRVSEIFVAELNTLNRFTGNYQMMQASDLSKVITGERLLTALMRNYFVATPEIWKALVTAEAS